MKKPWDELTDEQKICKGDMVYCKILGDHGKVLEAPDYPDKEPYIVRIKCDKVQLYKWDIVSMEKRIPIYEGTGEVTYKIKPLELFDHSENDHGHCVIVIIDTAIGHYKITLTKASKKCNWHFHSYKEVRSFTNKDWGYCNSIEHGKTLCQQHYETEMKLNLIEA